MILRRSTIVALEDLSFQLLYDAPHFEDLIFLVTNDAPILLSPSSIHTREKGVPHTPAKNYAQLTKEGYVHATGLC